MKKLLIADCNEDYRLALTAALKDSYHVLSCRTGTEALELLRRETPDILVLDLMLPEIDGITLLRCMAAEKIRPAVLVTLAYQSPFILAALEKYGVAYAVSKPCDANALASQVCFLADSLTPEEVPAPLPEFSLPSILLQLGIKPKLDGYEQLLLAIPRYLEDPRQNLTKELYDFVGHAVGKTALAAERSMRHAIQSAWSRADMNIWRQYFPAAPDGTVPKPTVGSFIAHIGAILESHQLYQKRA